MRHRLRNRIFIQGVKPDVADATDADVNPGDALKLGVTPMLRTPDVSYAAYAAEATIAT